MKRASHLKSILALVWLAFGALFPTWIRLNAQSPELPPSGCTHSTDIGPNLRRFEGSDSKSGVHYVRLLLSLPVQGNPERAPRFTVECDERNNKRDLLWFVSFGGVQDPGFDPRFISSEFSKQIADFTAVDLKMTFEGYIKSKSFTRSWALPPGGEFRYRNPAAFSPNLDSPRFFMPFLNSLPGLRIARSKQPKGQSKEILFPTRSLLDEMNKTPSCAP
jgi:hypothetical protein